MESVGGRCGYFSLETLKANGFPNIIIPPGQSGSLRDDVLENAVSMYQVMFSSLKDVDAVYDGIRLQEMLQEMKRNKMSGIMLLMGDPDDSDARDHAVPILYKDGNLIFYDDCEKNKQTINTDISFYENDWWTREGYDMVYEGVDKMIAIMPPLQIPTLNVNMPSQYSSSSASLVGVPLPS